METVHCTSNMAEKGVERISKGAKQEEKKGRGDSGHVRSVYRGGIGT